MSQMTRRQTWTARVLAIATLTWLACLLVSQSRADASPRQLLPPLPTVSLTVPDLTTVLTVPDVTLLPTTLPTILPTISVPTTLPQILPTTSTAAPTTAPTTASTVAGAPRVTTAPGAPAPPAGAPAPTVAGGPTGGPTNVPRDATDAPIGETEAPDEGNAIPPGVEAPDRVDEGDVGETADEVMIDPATGVDLAAARPPSETPTPIERLTGFAFPIGLALLIAGFLLVQHRLDADDPKLAPSPARNPDAMPFRDGSA